MKNKKTFLVAITLLASALSHATDTKRTLVWDREALQITLSVGNERFIEFPQPLVDLQMPQYLASGPISRPQLLPDGRLFWLANEEWDAVRIRAIGSDGEIYLIDVNASSDSDENNPIEIVKSIPVDEQQLEDAAISRVPTGGYDYIDLARFAAQHVYGPSRLIKPLSGVSRVSMEPQKVDIYRGVGIEVTTVAQWQTQLPERYLTVLKVANKTRKDADIDPRLLRGTWQFAASHNNSISPYGYMGDTTHIYTVSDKPFHRSIPTVIQARVDTNPKVKAQ